VVRSKVERGRHTFVTNAKPSQVIGAIDVGTNAVRLELARPTGDGFFETLHQERDPIRPGEGVFATGAMPRQVANRLIATLRRLGAHARREQARLRVVATSALREASNREEVVRRARDEAEVTLEVISGREEARLICLGVLAGKPPGEHSCIIDLGGGSTEVATAIGETPTNLWSVALGAVRLTELFEAHDRISKKQLKLMRAFAAEAIEEALPGKKDVRARVALGSSGTINSLIVYAAGGGQQASLAGISQAVDELVELEAEGRRKVFDPRRADIIVAGGIILEATMRHLGLRAIKGTDRGLRDGVIVDLMRRKGAGDDGGLAENALALARRFDVDEDHCRQVAWLALGLFDDLASFHRLPASARPLLEVAALLHDVGHAVSYQKHHKHSHYLIANADFPGLSDDERQLAALIARFHRRSPPEVSHELLEGLTGPQLTLVRKASTLLRIAVALDRSHHQVITRARATAGPGRVTLRLTATRPADLEVWSAEHELPVWRRIFGRPLEISVSRR
jgi:exopolyphosphatase/guanosine-5'-triphosphate,3'-diphosphate pyrophosphatase